MRYIGKPKQTSRIESRCKVGLLCAAGGRFTIAKKEAVIRLIDCQFYVGFESVEDWFFFRSEHRALLIIGEMVNYINGFFMAIIYDITLDWFFFRWLKCKIIYRTSCNIFESKVRWYFRDKKFAKILSIINAWCINFFQIIRKSIRRQHLINPHPSN